MNGDLGETIEKTKEIEALGALLAYALRCAEDVDAKLLADAIRKACVVAEAEMNSDASGVLLKVHERLP